VDCLCYASQRVTSLSPPPPLPPPSQWKRLVRDTELMDLLAPSEEEKRALLMRDIQHSPEAAAKRHSIGAGGREV
jgi:hypothetical protein